jgi:hypothetical protein
VETRLVALDSWFALIISGRKRGAEAFLKILQDEFAKDDLCALFDPFEPTEMEWTER